MPTFRSESLWTRYEYVVGEEITEYKEDQVASDGADDAIASKGMNNYSGYGASSGKPGEENTYADNEAVYQCLETECGISQEDIILYGQSVGSGPTLHFASRLPRLRGVVLHSAILPGLRVVCQVNFTFCFDIYKNVKRIEKVKCPVLVICGTDDVVVNWSHGNELWKLAREPYDLLWIEGGGHCNLELYLEAAMLDDEQCYLHPKTSFAQDAVLSSYEVVGQNEQVYVKVAEGDMFGEGLTSTAVKKGLISLDVSSVYQYKNTLVDVKVDTESNISTTLTVLEVLPSTKLVMSVKLPGYNSGKVEVQGLVFGAEAGVDTVTGKFTKFSAGIGVAKPDYHAAFILANKGDTIKVSGLYHLDEKQKASAVAELTRRLSTVGGLYTVDPRTAVKARLNNTGKLAALPQPFTCCTTNFSLYRLGASRNSRGEECHGLAWHGVGFGPGLTVCVMGQAQTSHGLDISLQKKATATKKGDRRTFWLCLKLWSSS